MKNQHILQAMNRGVAERVYLEWELGMTKASRR